jgi:hypothetical protein
MRVLREAVKIGIKNSKEAHRFQKLLQILLLAFSKKQIGG